MDLPIRQKIIPFEKTRFWGLFFRSEGHPWPVPCSSMALVTENSPQNLVSGNLSQSGLTKW